MAAGGEPVAEPLVPGLPGLLDSIDQAVIAQDASGRIRLLNAVARRLFPHLRVGDEFDESAEYFTSVLSGCRVRRQLADGWQAWVLGDVTDKTADRQNFMLAASRELAAGVGHDAAATALVRLAVPMVGERAAVLLPAPRARVSWWRLTDGATRPTSGTARAPAPRTAPVLAGALRGTSEDMATVPARELTVLAAVLGTDVAERAPVVVAPLPGPDRTEGLIVVARPVETKLIAELAALAGPAIEAGRRRRDQANALTLLQAPLLPPQPDALPTLPGAQLGVAHRPAAGELAVGGDFYLVRPTQESAQNPEAGALLALGDVCGKGAEALAESARVQHSLAALMLIEQDPLRLLYLLNRALLAAGRTIFTTLLLGALRPVPAGLSLTLATGGHPAPMVLRNGGNIDEVGVPGTVVGILPDARFGKTSITLAPGETCVLYSDGATEACRRIGENEEQFGQARLAACLRDCAGMTAQAVATRVKHTVTDWLGRNDRDDLAVLAVRAVTSST